MERRGEWNDFCEHEDEDFLLGLYNRKREDIYDVQQEYEENPSDYLFLELAYYISAFKSLCHAIKEKHGTLPDEIIEDLVDQDGQESKDDVEESSIANLGINNNEMESISSREDDEDLDPKSYQIEENG